MEHQKQRQKIGVVGSGISGILSAYLLSREHDVTLLEANRYVGGHTNTIVIERGPDAGLPVDTGFIVLNDKTYPTLHRFLAELGVPVRYADMSFSLWDVQSGFQYGSRNLQHLFAQRRNILNPRFLKMLLDVRRFWTVAGKDLDGGQLGDETLRSWLLRHRFTGGVVEDYLVPISAAIWSSPSKAMMDFPIITFLNFFKNHGLLRYLEQPRWQTVVGGSFAYVKRFQERFKGTVKVDAAVQSVRRTAEEVYVRTRGGEDLRFDQIVIAVHADEVLPLLSDPSSEERDAFSPWSYQRNHTVLHTDSTVLPPLRSAWASWNYVRERAEDGSEPVSLTYHMNNLQGFTSAQQYCVTLNPRRDIDPSSVVREIQYTHPVYTPAAMRSQAVISGFRGTRRTWYAGSYLGFGFHEDAARSAAEVAKGFGIKF